PVPSRCPLCPQGPLVFLFCVVLSKEVRRSLRASCARGAAADPALVTKAMLTAASRCDSTYVAGRPAGGSAASLPSTARSQHSYIPFVLR
ncbi:CELR2 protein, partial [Nothocercus nigrocapillus]|nr:CELR2 protein [Nothocercus nigrocapillus]